MNKRQRDTLLQSLPMIIVTIVLAIAVTAILSTREAEQERHLKEVEANVDVEARQLAGRTSRARKLTPVSEAEVALGAEMAEAAVKTESTGTLADEYGMYRTTEDWLMAYGGMALVKDGKFYAMDGRVPGSVISRYGVGCNVEGQTTDVAILYAKDVSMPDDVPTEYAIATVSVGDFPILKIKPDDEIRIYGDVPERMILKNMKFSGNTLAAVEMNPCYAPILNGLLSTTEINIANPGVFNIDDTPVDDVRNLEYGREYKYTWYTGITYNEKILEASSRAYVEASDAVEVGVTMTENGYATVDFSNVEPGIYSDANPLVTGVFEVE